MKRIITCLLSAIVSLGAYAQIADGYYRLKCKETGRYLTIHNDYINKESAKRTGEADLQSLETIASFDDIVDDPGSIIYMKKTPTGWAIEGQGFTTEGQLDLQLTPVDDAYLVWCWVTYQGMDFAKYLRDYEESPGYSYITTDPNLSTNRQWYFIPVDDTNYFGLKGDVQVGSNYYTTIFATFPIQLGSSMKAFAVNTLSTNTCTLEDIGNVVPPKTPAVIQCAGAEASANKVTPVTSNDATVGVNRLSGELFCYPVLTPSGKERRDNPAWNALDYDPQIMRVIGESDGKLCFVTSSDLVYMPANKAFLYVTDDAAPILPTDGTTGIQSVKIQPTPKAKGRFNLQGVQIPDNVEPQKGSIYIEDGKLVLKK